MFFQIFQWWNIVIYFCHRRIMPEIYIPSLSITLLGNDNHPQSFCRVTAFPVGDDALHGRSVKQHHDVRILFDSSALAQVCQFRTSSGAILRLAVQLTKQYDGNMQLLGQQLGFPGGLCHFLFAVAVSCLVAMSQSCR